MFAVSIILCLLALGSTYFLAKRSPAYGIGAAFFWGYLYGILRANVLSPASHFIFDCSLVGLYAGCLFNKSSLDWKRRSGALSDWMSALVGWTIFMAFLPFQTPLITLVGLRGNLFFLPVLLIASRLREAELRQVIYILGGLNLLALGFAVAEYYKGIEPFFPLSPVTLLIYKSRDAGGGNYRIPATFGNAHAFAGTMVGTLPLLLGALGAPSSALWQRLLLFGGAFAALVGVLFANTRTNFVLVVLLLIVFLLFGKIQAKFKFGLLGLIGVAGLIAMSSERFQRFRSIESTDVITERIAGSVNRSFLEVIFEFPMGNGLGGGGTSIPHFLASQMRRPVLVENEYARIALELGIPGMILWILFIGWILSRGLKTYKRDRWTLARRLILFNSALGYAGAMIGTGMLTAIPATLLSLFSVGFLVTRPHEDDLEPLEASPTGRF